MEEDSGVKAPVTRLRRRLSVEQSDDVKSPGPATPTKKRGGRLAAKPQLELIDEHGANLTPSKRTTRKTSVKEAADTAEEKTVTPSRRSTRIKSNTSIVSETTQSYDSPRAKRAARRTSQVGSDSESSVTPIRPSVEKLETTLSGKPYITEVIIEEENDSVKSDDTTKGSENSLTRKSPRLREKRQESNNMKNIDIKRTEGETSNDILMDQLNNSKPSKKKSRKSTEQITNDNNSSNDDIPEVKLNSSKQSQKKERLSLQNNDEENSINTPEDKLNVSQPDQIKGRMSTEKSDNNVEVNVSTQKERKSINKSIEDIEVPSDNNVESVLNDSKQLKYEEKTSGNSPINETEISNDNCKDQISNDKSIRKSLEVTKTNVEKLSQDNLSDSSLLLIKELEKKPKKESRIINKSASALDNNNSQSKRHRTKSWTVTTLPQDVDGLFFSDNETTKKKIKKRTSKEFKRQSNHTGSGDNENSAFSNQTTDKEYSPTSKSKNLENKAPNSEIGSPKGNNEISLVVPSTIEKLNESSAIFFQKGPIAILQSTVYFEDSDTDGKGSVAEDQCVPVIDNQLVEKDATVKSDENNSMLSKKHEQDNNSCEPMDIDETMPTNVSLTEFPKDETDGKHQKRISSSILMDKSLNKGANKSKRKSSLSSSQNLERSQTENKSTLILSQIKDVSSTEHNVSKSPKLSNDILSKSVDSTGIGKDKALDKKNLSQDYSTSTPLQQKKFLKLGMQINSSIIDSSNVDKKQSKAQNASKHEVSQISKPSESSSESDSDLKDEEELSSKDENEFIDEEAEVASDDYESGDSRDDEEKKYEDENEIVEKGETLDSDDDLSNDSDYEKDSFVVSSAEEDKELLSGTEDDILSMSDNELTMSKKSKKKYNERKQKEQKMASREMYEARHNNNESDEKFKKNKRQRIESSSDDSKENIVAPVKRNKRLRLSSAHDDDLDKSNSMIKKKSKVKRLSESICDESVTKEQEISSMCDRSVMQTDDPLSIQIKLEPKTPMKDLNISTVQIKDNIEEVEVDGNISIVKSNEETDPLQATILDQEDSSMSENSDIRNNYDSVLNELNANKIKTPKTLDRSLNLNKKPKSLKEPIFDQLNLTKAKNIKKQVGRDVTDSMSSNCQDNQNKAVDLQSSSDSIDLQLLFSEDSNNDVMSKSLSDANDVDDFIPLKRTPGKINILASEDDNKNSQEQAVLNESTKKKNKKRKSQNPSEEQTGDEATDSIQFIMDTQGTYKSPVKPCNTSLNSSSKKKKNRHSVSFQDHDKSTADVTTTVDEDDGPMEVSYGNSKNKKKNRKSSENRESGAHQEACKGEDTHQMDHDVSRESSKKLANTAAEDTKFESSLNICVKSDKKKKKRPSGTITENTETKEPTELSSNVSMGSTKKNKQNAASKTESNEGNVPKKLNESLNISKQRKRDPFVNEAAESIVAKEDVPKKKNKKRKERDDDVENTVSKIFKENSFDKVHITRLPASVLCKLEDQPRKEVLESKKSSLISTTPFIVEDTRKRRNKPSKFLEESVYLNDDNIEKKQKGNLKRPKVLPFIPTAVTSGSGFTTSFKINIIPQEVQFVAQTKSAANFKNDYLYGKKIKRMGTYETYKKQRNVKMSKF